MAVGLAAAFDYLLTFTSTKTYYNLETSISMPGITLINCVIAGLGIVLMYKIMPETENKTLEDIELHFSDDTKKITDRKIAKNNSTKKEERTHLSDDIARTKDSVGLEANGINQT